MSASMWLTKDKPLIYSSANLKAKLPQWISLSKPLRLHRSNSTKSLEKPQNSPSKESLVELRKSNSKALSLKALQM